eukprot:6307101-Karenia_brevis.AAC.1
MAATDVSPDVFDSDKDNVEDEQSQNPGANVQLLANEVRRLSTYALRMLRDPGIAWTDNLWNGVLTKTDQMIGA